MFNGPAMIGPYEIRGELGQGAMATVWRAWDTRLEREVAIKEPLFDSRLPEDVLEELGRRFVAEGRAAARLSHPGIVTVYSADVLDGRPIIVMELVEGSTLSNLLRSGPLSPANTLAILDQLLDAVGYAHARGVVHRDIKPDNIFVTNDGRVKLADFGIAHVEGANMTHATMAGAVLGTPGYMSPEQARGAEVDARSDLFSVGVIAYEMLTGKNPFGAGIDADPTTLIYRIVHEPAPELPDVTTAGLPADLRPAIMAALSKDPAGRPSSAEEFKQMLHGVYQPAYPTGAGASYPSYGSAPVNVPQKKALSWLPYALVGGVGALILVFALFSATKGGGGGGGSASGGSSSYASASSGIYLGVSDGYVAIYTPESTEPYQVSDVAISDLDPEDAADLGAQVPADTLDDAKALLKKYKKAAKKAQEDKKASDPATSFPRFWTGTFEGYSQYAEGGSIDRKVQFSFSKVTSDGYISGVCSIGVDDTGPGAGEGSYNVEGHVDWSTNSIELWGTTWANQGDLKYMRRYHGTVAESCESIVGTCDFEDGSHAGAWRMVAM